MANTASSIIKKAIEDAGFRAIEFKKFALESEERFIKSHQTVGKLLEDPNNVVFTINQETVKFYIELSAFVAVKKQREGQVVRIVDTEERYLLLNGDTSFTPRCNPIDEPQLRRFLQNLKEGDSCVVCFDKLTVDNDGASCNTCLNMICNTCFKEMKKSPLSVECPVCRSDIEIKRA